MNFDSAAAGGQQEGKKTTFASLVSSRDLCFLSAAPICLQMSALPLKENPANLPWIVMKYGGTSVGKFLDTIATEIVP